MTDEARRPRAGVNPPVQRRSRETFERILRVTEAMLEERTFERATIADIVARADSSVGSFFARFDGKEALLAHLIDRHHAEMLGDVRRELAEDLWNGIGLEARARAWVGLVVGWCRTRRGVLRARFVRNVTRPDRVPADQAARSREIVAHARAFFRPCLAEVRRSDPEAALTFALELVDSMVGVHVLVAEDPLANFDPVDDGRLEEETTAAFLAYLAAPQ